jgi:acyl-CoA reductase-like NAD-dependent aldehyde dehydrogenase
MTNARTTLPTGNAPTALDVDDPFRGDVAAAVPLAGWNQVATLLERARAAFRAHKASRVSERIALCERAIAEMERDRELIAKDISRMMGKPLKQAQSEVSGMAGRARYMMSVAEASLADVALPTQTNFERRIVKEPLGVVVDLPAWNYPLLTAVNAIVPAILAGNAVIVKHSPRTPLCGEHFAGAFRKAGAPENLVQALSCDPLITARLVGDRRVDHVVFTGSIFGGRRIQDAAAKHFANLTLELGGNDPAYVAADCDFQNTVDNIVDGAMYNAGQSCCAVERVYVNRSIYERFIDAAEVLVRGYMIGDPMDEGTTLGPIAQPAHITELEDFVADARAQRARVILGGNRTSVGGQGRFFEATLIANVPQEAKLMQSESFGPILAVSPVDSDDEALAKMNDSRVGLTASVWTQDPERAARFARDLEAGTVYMNRCDSVDPALPWSGVKESGRGFSLSHLAFDQLTRPKAIHFRLRF